MNVELNVFLLMGQSNMAGRGRVNEVPALRDLRVWMFRNGCWTTAEEPLHTDKPEIAGVGLGMSFAVELIACDYLTPIGLVPCAVGGTPLSRWMPGADLYENAVSIAQRALSSGTLKGILWHQGENDSVNAMEANTYGERFQHMISNLRLRLTAERVPVITGELGTFMQSNPNYSFLNVVNHQLRELKGSLPFYDCVSANGLTAKDDGLHFNSKSLREFGQRYANAYKSITGRHETAPAGAANGGF